MNLFDRDLFEVYRLLLTTVCVIYFIVISVRVFLSIASGFLGNDRHVQVARNYALVLLLRLRVASFKRELLAIAVYLIFFVVLMAWH